MLSYINSFSQPVSVIILYSMDCIPCEQTWKVEYPLSEIVGTRCVSIVWIFKYLHIYIMRCLENNTKPKHKIHLWFICILCVWTETNDIQGLLWACIWLVFIIQNQMWNFPFVALCWHSILDFRQFRFQIFKYWGCSTCIIFPHCQGKGSTSWNIREDLLVSQK